MFLVNNNLGTRIKVLADKNERTFDEQLELMTETFELMPIQKLSILPHPQGGARVPVVEVSEPVIQRG